MGGGGCRSTDNHIVLHVANNPRMGKGMNINICCSSKTETSTETGTGTGTGAGAGAGTGTGAAIQGLRSLLCSPVLKTCKPKPKADQSDEYQHHSQNRSYMHVGLCTPHCT